MAKIILFSYAAKTLGFSSDFNRVVLDIPVKNKMTLEDFFINVAEQYPGFSRLINKDSSSEIQLMRILCGNRCIFNRREMQFTIDNDTVVEIIPLIIEG